jgi:hypothetical protein
MLPNSMVKSIGQIWSGVSVRVSVRVSVGVSVGVSL